MSYADRLEEQTATDKLRQLRKDTERQVRGFTQEEVVRCRSEDRQYEITLVITDGAPRVLVRGNRGGELREPLCDGFARPPMVNRWDRG